MRLSIWFLIATVCFSPGADAQKGLRTRRTKEAIVKSNTSKDIANAVGKRIDNFCKEFGAFYDELGMKKRADNKLVARLFNTYEEYETQYIRNNPGETAPKAYFSPSLNAIVLYNDEGDITLRQTLFHECSHQYLNRYTNDAPKWLNEGMAEFFEGWRMTPEGTKVDERFNLYDLTVLQRAIKSGETLPLPELVGMDYKAFNSYRKNHPNLHSYLHYCTSWGLVWYSLKSGIGEHRERIVQYLRDLSAKGPRAKFEVDDWEAFEADWKKFILGLDVDPVDATDFLLLAGGHRRGREYKEAIALYTKALELEEGSPTALYNLGFCSKRLGHYDTALEWLEKARAADPKNASAPYQMSRIVLGIDNDQAPSDPGRALDLAEAALESAGGESPQFMELVAHCLARSGDGKKAQRLIRKIIKLVDDDEMKAYYKELGKRLKD